MGYEILVALSVVVVAPLVILGLIGFWLMTHRERGLIEDHWRSYALSRDRTYVPAKGEWPNRSSPTVRWSLDGTRLELSVVGVEANARTRLIAWPKNKLLGELIVATRAGGRPLIPAGIVDPAFESAFTAIEKPLGLAARILDTRARRALLGFWQRDDVVMAYRRGKIILEWPGRESNAARIDEAARVVRDLTRSVDDGFGHPVALVLATGRRSGSASRRGRTYEVLHPIPGDER